MKATNYFKALKLKHLMFVLLLLPFCSSNVQAQDGTSIDDAYEVPVDLTGSALLYDSQWTTGIDSHFDDTYGYSSPDVWYTFTLEGDATLSVSLFGSSFDTMLYLLDENGDEIMSNDDYSGLDSALMNKRLGAGKYYIVMEGAGDEVGHLDVTINLSGDYAI